MDNQEIMGFTPEFDDIQKKLDVAPAVQNTLDKIQEAGGITIDHVAELEEAIPGSVMDNYPEGGFSAEPNPSMEGISTAAKLVLGGILVAVFALISKFFGKDKGQKDKEGEKRYKQRDEDGRRSDQMFKDAYIRDGVFNRATVEQQTAFFEKANSFRNRFTKDVKGTSYRSSEFRDFNDVYSFFYADTTWRDFNELALRHAVKAAPYKIFCDSNQDNMVRSLMTLFEAMDSEKQTMRQMLADFQMKVPTVMAQIDNNSPTVDFLDLSNILNRTKGAYDQMVSCYTREDPYKAKLFVRLRAVQDLVRTWRDETPRFTKPKNVGDWFNIEKEIHLLSAKCKSFGDFWEENNTRVHRQLRDLSNEMSKFYVRAATRNRSEDMLRFSDMVNDVQALVSVSLLISMQVKSFHAAADMITTILLGSQNDFFRTREELLDILIKKR